MALGPYSILLIEDNPIDVKLAEGRLAQSGLPFHLTAVDNRAGFLEAFKPGKFDMVLADYSLPHFDGLSALEIVRAQDKRLPFIFVSGVLGEDVAVETLLRGATDYVLKSKMERFIPAVRRALAEYEEMLSRERVEEELKTSEGRFETLTNALPSMVWTASDDGRLTFVNRQWMENVGRAEHLFDEETIHPHDLELCRDAWENAVAAQRPFEVDCRYRVAADGTYRWHLVRGTPMPASKKREWIGTATDTELQRNREAHLRTTEKLALTGRLSSVIAHEINNPLEALMNIFYLLGSEGMDGEHHSAHLKLAEQELMRISAITKQTLQWSRDESVISEVSLREITDETLQLFTRKLHNKSIAIRTVALDDVRVRVVSGELRQVISNLVSNAIDAVAENGRITIRISKAQRGGEEFACISISDNGPGIAPEQLKRLFQPFQTTKGSRGNGLGLFISRELVDRQGGELVAQSEMGAGTTMSIYLPVA